ncbi:hypothetical protein J3T99_01990 [Acetobacteraceae bacterium B3987]|nr:hypothetical protein [Acetobacteraceae bacterium B3987]
MRKINFIEKLSLALGPHTDLEFGRAALISVLKELAHPQESVEFFRVWVASNEPQLSHDRWFQRVMNGFLLALPADLRIGDVIAGLEQATMPPTTAETLERWSRRCIVPGVRHRLMVQARRARLRERLIGARY